MIENLGKPNDKYDVATHLLKSRIEKLSVQDGDLLIVRYPKELRQKVGLTGIQPWLATAGKMIRRSLDGIGKKKTDFMLMEEGMNIERIPADELRKIADRLAEKQ